MRNPLAMSVNYRSTAINHLEAVESDQSSELFEHIAPSRQPREAFFPVVKRPWTAFSGELSQDGESSRSREKLSREGSRRPGEQGALSLNVVNYSFLCARKESDIHSSLKGKASS